MRLSRSYKDHRRPALLFPGRAARPALSIDYRPAPARPPGSSARAARIAARSCRGRLRCRATEAPAANRAALAARWFGRVEALLVRLVTTCRRRILLTSLGQSRIGFAGAGICLSVGDLLNQQAD